MPKKASRGVARRIGGRIRLFREQAGLSLEDVAWEIGIGKPYLSRIERGERAASYDVLFAIAQRLGVLPADLVAIGKDVRTRLLEATRGADEAKIEEALRVLRQKG